MCQQTIANLSIIFLARVKSSQLTETWIPVPARMEYALLETGGEVWSLTPNIRYDGRKYWDFFDNITPTTERALMEEAEVCGFRVKICIPKFLPFTTKSILPQAAWIVRLYLRLMPLSGLLFGEQSFLILQKEENDMERMK